MASDPLESHVFRIPFKKPVLRQARLLSTRLRIDLENSGGLGSNAEDGSVANGTQA
jgi:hypothetical protein